jgi:Zn-dependent protease
MDTKLLLDGLLIYLCFIPVLTLHEFAHAWVAWKCGDNTAKNLGRVSINPIVHMDAIGTFVLPLLAIYLQISGSVLSGFIIGWGKPVPVDPTNLRNPRRDDTLIALAGPGMNLVLAFLLTGFARVGVPFLNNANTASAASIIIGAAYMLINVNLILAFFNLIPIPPLDGSHVIKNLVNMSYETYWRLTQYGFIAVILVLNLPGVRMTLQHITEGARHLMFRAYGLG